MTSLPTFAVFIDGEPKLVPTSEMRKLVGVTAVEQAAAEQAQKDADRLNAVVDAANSSAKGVQGSLATLENETIPTIETAVEDAKTAIEDARKDAGDAVADANRRIDDARRDLDQAISDLDTEANRAQGAEEILSRRITDLTADVTTNDTAVRGLIRDVDTARADDKRAITQRVSEAETEYRGLDRATNTRIERTETALSDATRSIAQQFDGVTTEFRGLDTTTNNRVTREVKALSDADKAISERIDSLVSQGGYDDTYLRGEISRVDQAAITREGVITRQIETVSASFTRSGGNLVPGSEFTTLDGWSMSVALPAASMSRNGTGSEWIPGGVEDVLTIVQSGNASNPANYSEVISAPFAVRPLSWYQFYVFASSHRARNWVTLFYYDVSGAYIGYAGEFMAPRYNNGGRDIGGWDQNGQKAAQAPAQAVYARLVMRKYDTLPGEAESVAWFWHPYVGESREGQTVWNPYAVGNSRGAQLAASARIDQAATSAADAKKAVADLSTSVDTRFQGVNTTIGLYNDRVTGLSTDVQGYVGRTTTLEAAATGGSSAAKNDRFAYWPDSQRNPTGWIDWAVEGRYTVERVATSNTGSPYAVRTTNDANVSSGFYQTVPVSAGLWVIEVTARREAGSLSGAGVTLSGIWNLDFLADPDINGEVRDSRDGETRTWTKTVGIDDRAVVNLHAMQGWQGFGRAIASHYLVWSKLSLRPAGPGDAAGIKNAADLVTVVARTKSLEDNVADLPNRYAAASRTSTLEAQVNRTTASPLNSYVDAVNGRIDAVNDATVVAVNARIEDRASAIADAKAGAVAQTVQTLRSEYDGTKATVDQQAGTIAGLNGKAAAYVKVVADAGNGRAALSLWSDQFGGAWSLTGDGLIDGNLTLNGSLTTLKVAPGAITGTTFATADTMNTYFPSGNQTVNGISCSYDCTGGTIRIDFTAAFSLSNGRNGTINFLMDGSTTIGTSGYVSNTTNSGGTFTTTSFFITQPPAGTRITIQIQWNTGGGGSGAMGFGAQRIVITELKR